jgi:PhnB protein
MTQAKSWKPDGFHTVTPSLVVKDGAAAVEFYQKALGAKEGFRMAGPDGKIMHTELTIGDSVLFLSDEFPGMGVCKSPQSLGGVSMGLNLYVQDCDATFQQAVKAGAQPTMPPQDMFWGDRFGQFTDPYGHLWSVLTRKEDLTPQEMQERGKQAMAEMAAQHKG